MRIAAVLALAASIAAASNVSARAALQAPSSPTFDVVSIRPNTSGILSSSFNERPDGGFTMSNQPVRTLIFRAYPPPVIADVIGLPDWAAKERFDVTATSSLAQATAADRAAMTRAMLADRFRLVSHIEPREQQVYHLVLARSDGTLGAGLKKYEEDVDCEARAAAERAAVAAGKPARQPPTRLELNSSPPPCAIYMRGAQGTEVEGKVTLSGFAQFLGGSAGRPVIDKTGLSGIYHIKAEYDRLAGIRGPAATDTPGAAPSVFTAVQEQLGLKLEPARDMRDMLVIVRSSGRRRTERLNSQSPTPNLQDSTWEWPWEVGSYFNAS